MGIMTSRLLIHLHKAVHNLQHMSKPGSSIYISHRTGPITFRELSIIGDNQESIEESGLSRIWSIRTSQSELPVVGVGAPQYLVIQVGGRTAIEAAEQ